MSQLSQMKDFVLQLLGEADIRINGQRPWDIIINNDAFYNRVLRGGSLALGESYMDSWWEVQQLDEFFNRLLSTHLERQIHGNWLIILRSLVPAFLFNRQSRRRSWQVGKHHYDIGNELYEAMLDKRLTYTCGYWKTATTLDQAQEDKLELTCRKLYLQPGMRVLDIGCGWGSFAKYAAEKYGVHVTGVTISKEQAALARERVKNLPVKIELQDYRDITGKFDRIVSLGMFEHVGSKNYRTYMRVAAEHLTTDGLFLLHTIGGSDNTSSSDPWLTKYIFPNGELPAAEQIAASINNLFVLEDWQNFGQYYDLTLLAWWKNFDAAWPILRSRYGDRFYRIWRYYLLSCAGAFRSRTINLWQIVLASPSRREIYLSVR